MLSWGVLFRLKQNLTGSLWAIPLTGAMLGVLFGMFGIAVDQRVALPHYWEYAPSTATTILATLIGAASALTGFVVTVSVLVVQIATDTISSRYMRLWLRDRLLKATLAVLLGTLTFSLQELRRVGTDFVPNLGVSIAGAMLAVGVLLFLLFLDRAIHRVRPVAVADIVAAGIRRATEEANKAATTVDRPDFVVGPYQTDATPTFTLRAKKAGALQAIDAAGLVRFAQDNDCLLVLVPIVGDFVSIGAPLVEVYGAATMPFSLERRLRGMVALGTERTIDQDPAFGIRIMVDIANMALSPAVNDPTTAVQVIDHLGETLRMLGNTSLTFEPSAPRTAKPWVIVPTRSWHELVILAVTEIREYGAHSIQVNRRLHAMLEAVRDSVPANRQPAIEEELRRLEASVAIAFADSVDLDRARNADPQGLGGRSRAPASSLSLEAGDSTASL